MATATEEATVTTATTQKLLEVDPGKFAALEDSRHRVNDAEVKMNVAKEDFAAKKKIFDAARSAFLRDFDRFVANIHGEDLPLFSQTEVLDRAKSDPIVTTLADRLIGAGHDVNVIIVAGYTADERAEAERYLDALDTNAAAKESGAIEAEVVEVPAFLLPQPLTPVEVADLAHLLAAEDLEIPAETIGAWKKTETAEAMDWLTRVEAIKHDKGDNVTVDDLPAAPEWLQELATAPGDESDNDGEDTE